MDNYAGLPFEKLVCAAQQGDQEAFAEIYRQTYPRALFVAQSITRNEQDAEDVLQEAYMNAFSKLGQLKDVKSFRAWFYQSVRNRTYNQLDHNTRKFNDISLDSSAGGEEEQSIGDFIEDARIDIQPEQVMERQEISRLMNNIMDRLSTEQRTCAMMFYFDEYSVKEIAEILAVSENTVKSRLNYARKYIKEEVLLLEKKGTKLYGLSPVPFFIWLLRGYFMHMPISGSTCAGIWSSVSKGLSGGTQSSAAGAAGTTAAGAVGNSGAAAGAAGAAGASGAAAIQTAITGKIIGLIAAVSLATAGGYAGYTVYENTHNAAMAQEDSAINGENAGQNEQADQQAVSGETASVQETAAGNAGAAIPTAHQLKQAKEEAKEKEKEKLQESAQDTQESAQDTAEDNTQNHEADNAEADAQNEVQNETDADADNQEQDRQAQEIAELNTYAENELTARLGRCEKGPFSCAVRRMGQAVDGLYASIYYRHTARTDAVEGQAGVITWKSADFDGDGSTELLVLTLTSEQEVAAEMETEGTGQVHEKAIITNNHMYLQMYQKTNGGIVLADEYEVPYPDVLGHCTSTDEDIISLKEANGKLYVYGDYLQGDDRFSFYTRTGYFLLAFEDGKWEEMLRFEGYSHRFSHNFEREKITADMEILSSIGLNKTAAGLSQVMDTVEKELIYGQQDKMFDGTYDAFCAEYPLKRPSADETEASDFMRITGTSTYPQEWVSEGRFYIEGYMNYMITTYE